MILDVIGTVYQCVVIIDCFLECSDVVMCDVCVVICVVVYWCMVMVR